MHNMQCKCGNSVRYINELGELTCGICPLKSGLDSIKLADVPALLKWARNHIEDRSYTLAKEQLKDIVQRRPQKPPATIPPVPNGKACPKASCLCDVCGPNNLCLH
jgi:hypothetical protein